MNAIFEMTMENGNIITTELTNILLEEIDGVVVIHADNGFMCNIIRDELVNEFHDEQKDVYEYADGTKYIIELN